MAVATERSAGVLYKKVRDTYRKPIKLSEAEETALRNARTAFYAAREQLETAHRSRKNVREERVAAAKVLYDITYAALEVAEKAEKKAEASRYRAADRLADVLYEAIAEETFRLTREPIRYVNSVPTGKMVKDYYGSPTAEYRTTVDDAPVPDCVRGFEAGDIRLVPRTNTPDDLRFEIQRLDDETYEGGARKERFGRTVTVDHERRSTEGVSIQMGGGNSRSIEDAEETMETWALAIRLARIIERIVEESHAK